jgi:predicted heme/steroid binding protein
MKRISTLILTLILLLATVSLQSFKKAAPDPVAGRNVFVFDPSMDMKKIQATIDSVFAGQSKAEFSRNRYALLFRPGKYNLDIQIGYYMSVIGLGSSPEDVIITGAVRSNTTHGNSVLTNFWRSAENITIIPSKDSTMVWGVSQAAPLRRIHLKGNLQLFDKGYASGGFLADSKIDGTVSSGPQQQWLSRNCYMKKWVGGNWNMMFVGVNGAPTGLWPEKPYTVINETPLLREKPYLTFDGKEYFVNVPGLMKSSSGVSWDGKKEIVKKLSLKSFYVVREGTDNSATINKALETGKNLLFTPGIYHLDRSLVIRNKNTTVIGIGMPSLVPDNGNAAIEAADADGITICGLTIDAGAKFSDQLFVMGEAGSAISHEKNPSFLFDIFFRVGGPAEGSVRACMVVNSSNVCIDHTWIWRADHGNGVGWSRNKAANGLIVNGKDVTVYGLFNEHFQEYQTLWNGENGRVYFYQSEMPYDPPTADSWKHGTTNGYASYKVSENVKNHEAWGLGIYNVFYNAPVIVDNAIECPANLESKFHHMIIFWLNGNKESVVRSIINGKGGTINVGNRKAIMD